MRTLTKKEKLALRIETNPNGFTVWAGTQWIIDGSLVRETGIVSIGLNHTKYFGVFNEQTGDIIFKKRKV